MFLESLLETSTQAKTRRGWATLTSFLLQVAVVGALILIPMLFTDALPSVAAFVHDINTISVPAGPQRPENPPPQPPEGQRHQQPPPTEFKDGKLQAPDTDKLPDRPYIPKDPEPPLIEAGNIGTSVDGVPGGTGTPGQQNGVINEMLKKLPLAKPDVTTSAPVHVISRITEGMLIRRVQPVYPRPAIITRTEGAVILHAIIGRDGVIRQLQVTSGHPLLVPAAVDAVRQWRYRPYYLNNQAVEVETQITVNFVLNR